MEEQISFMDDNKVISLKKQEQHLSLSPPSNPHSNVNINSSKDKFNRLIQRVIAGGVVPFLGAGLSMNSVDKDGTTIACTQTMTCAVCKELSNNKSRPQCPLLNNKCCPKPSMDCGQKRRLADTCEEYLWEEGDWEFLIKRILGIHKFNQLTITKAHRYIAYLARESVIEEAITSNYDNSLERAYRESAAPDPCPDQTSLQLSISCLHNYKKIAGQKGESPSPLKVYHVNGYVEDLNSNYSDGTSGCETIVLTERQLQNWGARQWSRDLLRDRLRYKNILFSGFGSPEPQVRQTVMDILGEFELAKTANMNDGNSTTSSEPDIWKSPNAVFIHAYEDLTFEQRQILSTYAKINQADPSKDWIVNSGNCFTKKDTPLLSKRQSGNLSADEFWEHIYKAVFWRLLNDKWLTHTSSFYYLLRASIPCADVLLDRVRQWLLPETKSTAGSDLFGRFPELLDINTNSLLLSELIWHIRHRKVGPIEGWYAPLREKGIIISSYFIFIYLLGLLYKQSNNETWSSWEDLCKITKTFEELGLGLEFCLPDDHAGKGLLLLAHEESLLQRDEPIAESISEYRIIVQAVLSNSFRSTKTRIQIKPNRKSAKSPGATVRYANIYQVAFYDLLGKDSSQVNNLVGLVNTFRTRLLYPNTALEPSLSRIKNRVLMGDE